MTNTKAVYARIDTGRSRSRAKKKEWPPLPKESPIRQMKWTEFSPRNTVYEKKLPSHLFTTFF